MKKRKIINVLGLIMVLLFSLTACASRKSDTASYDNSSASTSFTMQNANGVMKESKASIDQQSDAGAAADETITVEKQDKDSNSGSGTDAALTNSSAISAGTTGTEIQDKIIRRFSLEAETQEFDTLINKVNSEIDRLKGYVESSQISGRRYNYKNQTRHATVVARIPKDKVDEFVNIINDNANVVDRKEDSVNVTLDYTDTESRKKALEIEQDRLYALLEKTDTLKDIITLESRLSDIRYELQNYETKLRTYDNQVDYSTVTMNIQEVERITPLTKEKQTVWNRISTGFHNSIYQIGQGFTNFFVWFTVNLPYLLIWAVIIAAAAVFIRRFYKMSKKKEKDKNDHPPLVGPKPPETKI